MDNHAAYRGLRVTCRVIVKLEDHNKLRNKNTVLLQNYSLQTTQ